MSQNYRSGIVFQSQFNHFAGMHFGMAECAGKQCFASQQAVLIVEIHHDKNFTLLMSHL